MKRFVFPLFALVAVFCLFAYSVFAAAVEGTNTNEPMIFRGRVEIHGRTVSVPQLPVIADNPADGGTVTATYSLRPKSGAVQLTCSDTDGCDITMDETGAVDGTIVRIVNTSANVCNFADTSGVSETAGAFAMGQYDALTLMYANDRWVELARSNN